MAQFAEIKVKNEKPQEKHYLLVGKDLSFHEGTQLKTDTSAVFTFSFG